MKFAITIGSYKALDFVRLNIVQCRRIFGEAVSILVSDDVSDQSDQIKEVAREHHCMYLRSQSRMSHFSGDLQCLINSLTHADTIKADVALKLSQRLIPVLPRFREACEAAFNDQTNPPVSLVLPGPLSPHQLTRPDVGFYSRFPFLTDVVAMRTGVLSPAALKQIYIQRFVSMTTDKYSCLVETTMDWLRNDQFQNSTVLLNDWSVHVLGQPKVFLRKSQSTAAEYIALAKSLGIPGNFDCREWREIEGGNYVQNPTRV